MSSILQTDSLVLIPLKADHVPAIFALHARPEVAAYNTIGIPYNESSTLAILGPKLNPENKDNMGWVITDKKGVFMGEIGLILAPERFKKGEISYSLHPDFWGKGFATTAVKKLLDYAFNCLDLHRIEAGVAVENAKSIRVLEKVGMQREGHHRKILPLKTGWSDNFSYAILRHEYQQYK